MSIGPKDTFVLKDDDVIIRTHFIHRAPETYIEKEYSPFFGGNHVEEVNRVDIEAPKVINDKLRVSDKDQVAYAAPCANNGCTC